MESLCGSSQNHHAYKGSDRLYPQDSVEGGQAGIKMGDRDLQMGGAQATLFPRATPGAAIGLTTSSFSKCCFELRGLILLICNFL